jgi:Cytochrome c7 and related cytochrome c
VPAKNSSMQQGVPTWTSASNDHRRARGITGRAVHVSWFALPFVALGFFVLLASAGAQISPGPLSKPHQSLNGATNCGSCHKFGGQATLKCLGCHTEIGTRLNARKGLHAAYNIPPGSSQECTRCHSEHNGEDFPLIKWDIKAFDHKQTGYVLQGKHAGVDCNRCHTPARISPQERGAIRIKDLNRTYLGLPTGCATCHQDPHNGRLGQSCQQCHNFEDWKTLSIGQFDHSKTRYPLTGLHAQVACAKCHTPGPDNKPRYTGIPFNQCSDCHKDPHRGSFPQSCQSCHSTSGWKKISLTALNQRFDHSKTKFPLEGKHAGADCAQCHANGDFKKPLVFQKCMDCHKPDPHNGQFAKWPDHGECASCHNVNGWKPSTFTVKEHAASAYPLQGGHARVECSQCHIPRGRETLFKIKFERCTDCHSDRHAAQFINSPYFNACDRCHTLEGYKPSTFTLAHHKETRFVLTGGHLAVPCGDCHKESAGFQPKPAVVYHWKSLSCTSCHADPHNGQFKERMREVRSDKTVAGCEACHSTKSWKDLSRFNHSTTTFPLVGAHRATPCLDCHKPANLGTKVINVDFKRAPTQCEDCHLDVHGQQFSQGQVTHCVGCHNTFKWKPSLFDHDGRTGFPLRGAHQNVRCAECHKLTKLVAGKTVLFYKPTPKECEACHGPTNPVKTRKPI